MIKHFWSSCMNFKNFLQGMYIYLLEKCSLLKVFTAYINQLNNLAGVWKTQQSVMSCAFNWEYSIHVLCLKSLLFSSWTTYHSKLNESFKTKCVCTTMKKNVVFYNWAHTAKWIWESSIFSSIKPKYDKLLFVYFCFFP